jgi:hypothetical protein
MEIFFVLSTILLAVAISLGVGASTIAIVNFFTAIADGTIDPTERRMMGVTYIILRVAMVLIVLMLITQYMFGYGGVPTPYFGTTHAVAMGLLTAVLYYNAILMTYRIMPSTFGPAIQASSWYTLGVMNALVGMGIIYFSLPLFFISYAAVIVLAISLINAGMALLRHDELAKTKQGA